MYVLLIRNCNLKDTKSARKTKVIYLLAQLKGFRFVTTLVLVFKKIETESKTKYDHFYSNSMKMTLMMCLINRYHNYIKQTKIFRKILMPDY